VSATEPPSVVTLQGPNNYFLAWTLASTAGYNNYSTNGTLTPGEYTFDVDVGSELVPYTAYIHNPSITLILPEPRIFFAMSVLPLAVLRHRRYC
jgi:hypothetical protein